MPRTGSVIDSVAGAVMDPVRCGPRILPALPERLAIKLPAKFVPRYCSPSLLFEVRRIAGFGQGGDGLVDVRCAVAGGEARRAYTDFLDFNALGGCQRLADAAHAGAAVHILDSQSEFRHNVLRLCLMIAR